MSDEMKNNRREFIKKTGIAGLAVTVNPVRNTLNELVSSASMENKVKFLSPVDGDMLNDYDGKISDGSLISEVKVAAPSGIKLKINGITANYADGKFTAAVPLKDYKNVLEAQDHVTGETSRIVVYWLKNVVNKYRLSLDDNIWFLKDINTNAGKYKSIFENPYLGFLKEVHDTYRTKIHLNLYYQTEGFNLSQMTEKFKSEWKDNAGWLRLSFHALQNDPDKPYINAGYDQVKKDCIMVKEQISRFAGEELMGPVTTLHWGEALVDGCRALRDEGYLALAGYFNAKGPDTVAYYLDDEKRLRVNNRFIWRDNKEGIIFSRMALVINAVKQEEILPSLDSLRSDSHKPAYVDLMIHEQYFYPYYVAYQPDYRKKVMTAVKWAADSGYKPAFLSECVFG
jgi:hypothetical protein